MSTLLTIGEFSRLTHLSVKALRHYDDVGLLPPAQVDPSSGYRHYASAQVPSAHVIRRFRDLGMPLDEIRLVLDASDVSARNQAIIAHLERMEHTLEHSQAAVASLKELLEGKDATLAVEMRRVGATPAIVISERVDWDSTEQWLESAFDELNALLQRDPGARDGPDAALYSREFFERHVGEIVAFIPVAREPPLTGRVRLSEIPGADVAVTLHHGPFNDIDRTYGALGTFVAQRVLGADGPIREHYLITANDTSDPAEYRTEVGWPIRQPADESRVT